MTADKFIRELEKLLQKYEYTGVMYGMKLTELSSRFNAGKDILPVHEGGKIVIHANIFEAETAPRKKKR